MTIDRDELGKECRIAARQLPTFLKYLESEVRSVIITDQSGALYEHNGRRSLARELMNLFGEASATSGRTASEQQRSAGTERSGGGSTGSVGDASRRRTSTRGASRRVATGPGDAA